LEEAGMRAPVDQAPEVKRRLALHREELTERLREAIQATLFSHLTMTEALRRACWTSNSGKEALHVALETSGRYVNAFLEGYMSGRQEEILREQERTRHAFQRAMKRQARS
jgi:hypothetical protein